MSLNEVWEAASKTPFTPLVPKESQFSVGFNLLLCGKVSLLRSLSPWVFLPPYFSGESCWPGLGILGILIFGGLSFGAVFMICAAGVYV
ncbi:hypothetical protein N7492_001167 [Penicillium capsulatum]|uniref:Uncharacterized protein n=1 Tax=Penicillium capsulatum TaxID=69766 RepID=A0A9W9LZ67_9EURO|nr:hypothetical protein N7492_001167 [Penicillium capsulatum]